MIGLGHEPTCFSFSPRPKDALYEHIKISSRLKYQVFRKFAPSYYFSTIKTGIYDILHYHGDDYLCPGAKNRVRTFYGSALQEALNSKTLGRFFYQSLFYIFEWISCLKAGTLLGISQTTTRSLPLVKSYIPCGVPSQYVVGANKTDYPSILFLGDLDSRKRGSFLVDVFLNEILPTSKTSQLTVVGPQYCEGTNIRYLGNLEENSLISEYQKAWVYCMPSSYEGFGVPSIEAMACGTAVVATNNAGSREIIQHNYNGLLSNDSELGENLNRMLSDSGLRNRIVQNGLRNLRKKYDINVVAKEYEKIYTAINNRQINL